ncbi:DUF4340 domain-containing protein [Sedimenticola selenatireducens]|uniref:DUF4340 domain-containing protein n=1 Tax=Sedimenticola selenatireducens TaxID=191960 RepID=UPI0004B3DC4B|nr:DUF4340 domain-containing protein [Sedimenticola selenatireducens]
MRKQSLVNLLLLLLVAALGLFVWYTPDEESSHPGSPLTRLDPATVKRITISNKNGPRFVLQRGTRGWHMTEPYQVAANTPRIHSLLDLLSTPQIETFALPADRLAEFGLEQPLAELTFNQTKITFGGTHPYNYGRYLRIDDQLYLTNDIFPHHALARAEEFVSHTLFPDGEEISEINTPTWRLYRQQGIWTLDPDGTGSDPEQLQEKVAAWQHTRVSKVIKAPDTPPEQQLTIRLRGSEGPIKLGIISQAPRILLINQALGLGYQLNSDALLRAPGINQ